MKKTSEKNTHHQEELCGKLTFTGISEILNISTLLQSFTHVDGSEQLMYRMKGWVFNRENHYPLTPEKDGHIYVPENILRMDVYENEVYRC